MQENNNFQKIISQWRRMSGEQVESSAFVSMSGDSHNLDKKEEDSEKDLLVPDRLPVAIAGGSATTAIVEPAVITTQPEDKQEFIDPARDKEKSQDASGDSPEVKKDESDYLEHKESMSNLLDSKCEKDQGDKEDNVDSVYLRPPPPHKASSNTSTPEEEEDCGIKCLYYTLQCCDCVLM